MTIHPAALTAIAECLEAAGHGTDCGSALFRPVRNIRTEKPDKAITSDSICKMVNSYGEEAGLPSEAQCLHSLRATTATNALANQTDLAFVQKWLRHANIFTTRL